MSKVKRKRPITGDVTLFCQTAREVLKAGGFNCVAVEAPINQDAVYMKAWRKADLSRAICISASGLELAQNGIAGISNLARTRAKNAMATYDAARRGSTT